MARPGVLMSNMGGLHATLIASGNGFAEEPGAETAAATCNRNRRARTFGAARSLAAAKAAWPA
ncbi:MAG: hypothetical protein JW940_14670 [Polyangiaceae bacterium]|nr:hypothetical protein [Polyangiaceae bacterium]